MGSGNLALRKIYKNETTWIQKGKRKHKCNFSEHCLLKVTLLNNKINYYNVLKCHECLSFISIKESGNIQGCIFNELTKKQKSLPVITASYGHRNLIVNFSALDNVCYIGVNYINKDDI